MIQSFRNNLMGPLGIIIILFVGGLMVLTGFGSFGSGGGAGKAVASVNGVDITEQELSQAIQRRKDMLIQRQNLSPTDDQLADENLRGPVLEQLKQELAMKTRILDSGMRVSDRELVKSIQAMPVFQDENGKFDNQVYSNLLARNGYSSASFKAEEQNRLAQLQNENALTASSFSTSAEIDQLVAFLEQTRDFYSIEVSKMNVAEGVEVSDEEIQAYYDANASQFTEPEKLVVDYVKLSVDDLMKTVEISDEDIAAEYAARKDAFQSSTQYDLAHILVNKDADAQSDIDAAIADLNSGKTFAEVAANYSDDVGSKNNGGNLGVFSLDSAGFDSAFNDAVKSLKDGEVSEAIETPDGFHIIKLNKTIADTFAPLADKRDEIVNDLKRTAAEDIYVEQRELLAEAAFDSGDLAAAAAAIGAEVETTDAFSAEGGTGPAANNAFRAKAFGAEVRNASRASDVLDVSPSESYVLKVSSVQPAFVKSLEDVKSGVAANLRNQKISQGTIELAESVRDQIKAGADPEALAKELKLDYKLNEQAKRFGGNSSPAISSKAFTLPAPSPGSTVFDIASTKGGSALIGLTGINMGDKDSLEAERLQGIKAQIARQGQTFESLAYRSAVVDSAEIK